MKKIAILALAAIGAGAHAQLWNQSALVNVAGGGTGAIAGADLSQLEGTSSLFGFGAQTTANNVVADDFVVGAGGWNVTGLTFWAYQSFATTPTTITSVNFAIDTDLTSTTVAASGVFAVTATNIYRVTSTTTSNADRRLQRIDVTGLNLNLAAGTHWLKFNFAGTAASGPWAPTMPISNSTFGQNAQQSIGNAAFAPGLDAGSGLGQDLAFQVHGTEAVPEPMTMLVLAGAAAVAARRRKSSK